MLAVQFVDIFWAIFVMAGMEYGHIDTNLPGNYLVLDDMPWSHSLLTNLGWSALFYGLCRYALKLPQRASLLLGIVALSHWVLDIPMHRADLPLWPGGVKIGFGLWNYPAFAQILEIGLLGLCFGGWLIHRVKAQLAIWPAMIFFVILVAIQAINAIMPAPKGGMVDVALMALPLFLGIPILAAIIDWRYRKRALA